MPKIPLAAKKIKWLRVDKDLNQEAMAKILQCSQTRVCRIERGKAELTVEESDRLIKYYNLPENYFLSPALTVDQGNFNHVRSR